MLQDKFVDTPTSIGGVTGPGLPAALQGADPATTPVLMYCTGGIRCDIYSAHLRRLGFRNLLTLQVRPLMSVNFPCLLCQGMRCGVQVSWLPPLPGSMPVTVWSCKCIACRDCQVMRARCLSL